MPANDKQLDEARARIDYLDQQLQALLSERAEQAVAIGELKKQFDKNPVFYRPEREARVLEKVASRNTGPLSDATVQSIFRQIMSACLAIEQPLQVAYLGPDGTFTHAATVKHFGDAVVAVPVGAIDDVFREVEAGNVNFGVVPVENSTEGVVNHTLDMFMRSRLCICGEIMLRVHHNIISRAPKLQEIDRVYAHQQALAQCRDWLSANLAQARMFPVASNAEGVRQVKDDPHGAAIGSTLAAELYELPVVAANIEDEPDNQTRFLVISKTDVPPTGNDRTSLYISARNKPGALYHLLQPLSRHGIDMTRIESRPSRLALWEYLFFIDFNGHRQDEIVQSALRELEQEAALVRIIGSYPRAGEANE